jgi:hypothetical protein
MFVFTFIFYLLLLLLLCLNDLLLVDMDPNVEEEDEQLVQDNHKCGSLSGIIQDEGKDTSNNLKLPLLLAFDWST